MPELRYHTTGQVVQFSPEYPVCTEYYGFHFPWILNALSKKMSMLGYSTESEVLENISIFSEIGVNNIDSAKIYLAGIKSRECAIELSRIIDFSNENNITTKNKLFDLLNSVIQGEIRCSEKAFKWLELLSKFNGIDSVKYIEKVVIKIKYEKTENYTELHLRSYKNDIYLSSQDYKIKLKIRNEKKYKYEELINKPGVWFQRTKHNLWELRSNNPYICII